MLMLCEKSQFLKNLSNIDRKQLLKVDLHCDNNLKTLSYIYMSMGYGNRGMKQLLVCLQLSNVKTNHYQGKPEFGL
jgi:hypothetical protein